MFAFSVESIGCYGSSTLSAIDAQSLRVRLTISSQTRLRKSVEKSHDLRKRYKRKHEKALEEPLFDPLTSPVKCGSYGLGSYERYNQHKISNDDARVMKLWVV